jgi:hypothetical protein
MGLSLRWDDGVDQVRVPGRSRLQHGADDQL